MRARLVFLSLLVTLGTALTVVGCSVVGDGKVNKMNPPFGLDDTVAPSTTPSSTTTAAPTTTNPGSSTTAVQTEPVRLYFITNGQLTYVTQSIPAPAAPQLIIQALQPGPQGDLAFALRTAVPRKAEIKVSATAGVATVELPVGFFDTIAVSDQRLVIGPIVLTLTDSRGVGQVMFNEAVPRPSGEITQPGQLLTKVDFQSLLLDATAAAATTTSSVVP